MDEAPALIVLQSHANEADRGILSRQMDVDRQMLITAERDGYFGLRASPRWVHSCPFVVEPQKRTFATTILVFPLREPGLRVSPLRREPESFAGSTELSAL